jgi:chemotaxis protein histidine kinase CheA
MARRRSKTSATGGNMDSLLDALTNVVGILVIVLVAVQISSQEAAKRMEEMIEKIDPEEQKKIEQQAQEAKAKIEQVTQAIAQEKKQEKIDPEKLLSALRDDIEAAEKKAKADRIAAETAEKAAEKAKLEAEKLRQRLMAQLAKLEEEAKEYTVARDDLIAQLKKTKIPVPPPPKEVRPPTPRPPMIDPQTGNPQLQRRDVFVKNGRVIPVIDPGDEMKNAVVNRIKYIIGAKRLPITPDNWLPNEEAAKVVIDEFNKNPPRLKNFSAELTLVGKAPQQTLQIVLTPTEEAGEPPDQAIRGWFRRTIFGTQRKYYLNYRVATDSFEEYLAIRKVTDNEQFFAGWKPETNFVLSQSSGFRAGVKPPPAPPRPPAPRKPGTVTNVLD